MDDPGKYQHPISPYARIFPDMAPAGFKRLVDDVGRQGLLEPVALLNLEVVDGYHRLRACEEAGVEPHFVHLPPGTDPLAYVLAKNSLRRNMNQSQKAIVAYRVSALSKRGRPRKEQQDGEHPHRAYTQGEAAELLGVSRREVGYVARIYAPDSGVDPEVLRAVEQGEISAGDAPKVIGETEAVQREALARVLSGDVMAIGRAIKQVKREATLQEEDTRALESAPATPVGEAVTLYHSPVSGLHRLVAPESVDVIATHPPAAASEVQVFSELAGFAAHALRPEGVMAVLASASHLPQVIGHLQHADLQWVMEFDLRFSQAQGRPGPPYWVDLHRRPLLVYAKTRFPFTGGDDVIVVPAPGELPEGQERWHPVEVGMAMVVQRFTRPGQVVCDPVLLGRAGTALGALKSGCTFIGAARELSSRDLSQRLISEAEGTGLS